MDTRLDILGVVLIIFALITLLSFLSKEPGALTRVWLRTLYQGFGWGAWVVPIPIGGIGVWLIWRHFGDQLPAVDPIRIAGIGIVFVGTLVLAQAAVSAISPIGTVWYNPAYADPASPEYDPARPNKVWEEAVACPARPQELVDKGWVQTQAYWSSADIARCGHGGGFIGSAIQLGIQGLIGGAAVFIIAIAAIFGGGLMATRKTLKDVMEYLSQGYGWVRDRRTATSQPEVEEEDEEDEKKTVKQAPLPAGGRAGQVAQSASDKEKSSSAPADEDEDAKEKKPAPALPGRPSIVTGRGPAGEQPSGAPASASVGAAASAAAGSSSAVASPPRPGGPPGARPSPIGTSQPAPKPGDEPDEDRDKKEVDTDRPADLSGLPKPPGSGSSPGAPGLPRPSSAPRLPGASPDTEAPIVKEEKQPAGSGTGLPGSPPSSGGPGSPSGPGTISRGLPGSGPGSPASSGGPAGPSSPSRPGTPSAPDRPTGERGLPGSRPGGPSAPGSGGPDRPSGLPRPGSPPSSSSGTSGSPGSRPGGPPSGSASGLRPGAPPRPDPSGPGGPGAASLPRPGGPPPLTRPEAEDNEPDDDGTTPGGGPSGRPTPPRPGSPLSGASATGNDSPDEKTRSSDSTSPASASSNAESLPTNKAVSSDTPGSSRPGMPAPGRPKLPGTSSGRTFGPATPPAVLGGMPRPAPKPAPDEPVPGDSDDSDEGIIFDDLAEDRLLANAIDVKEDEARPSADETAKVVAADQKDDLNEDETDPATSVPPAPAAEKEDAKPPAPVTAAVPTVAARPALPAAANADKPTAAEKTKIEGEESPPAPGEPSKAKLEEDKSETKTSPPSADAAKADKEEKKPAAEEAKKSTPPKTEKKTPARPEWKMPETGKMLNPTQKQTISDEELRRRAEVIEQTLSSFGAPARVVEVNHGPVITQFGVEPDYIDGRGGKRVKVKVGKISALADDIALALAAPTIRIEAPVPGKGFVGIEVPNAEPSIVGLRDVMDTPDFAKIKSPLKLALGQDVSGAPICADLTSMPHLLIAGTTGSGKSVCVNGIICTMLMNMTPDELKMIMVDPKRVELTNYNGIPHLMAPVVTELERIVGVLKWVQREMDDRYRKFAMAGARNISDYNQRVEKGRIEDDQLPYILVIVDELADLMMLAPDETERVITRLAQMARATGIHIILSTQRPSVDVVTGLIKANFPSRIAFAVATGVDSRVILDMPGAEKLLGRGDMLFQAPDAPLPVRMQGVYVSDEEIDRIVQHWRKESDKMPDTLKAGAGGDGGTSFTATQKQLFSTDDEKDDEVDDLYDEAVELVRDMEKASISLLQRHLRIGYTRAARLIEAMEERGIVGEHEGGSAPREVLEEDEEDED